MKKVLIFTSIMSSISLACYGADDLFDEGLWELSPEELGQIRVTSIASGTPTPLDKAAAVATVITAEDIEKMGATELDDVLETVPGLHVNKSFQAYFAKYTFRGISGSTYNPQALLLINGTPLTTLAIGNRYTIWGGMPVKSISRIEVIRGPGSALYGADAFAGVINVITKTARDIEGTQVGAGAGSFDTYSSWVSHGSKSGDLEIGVTLEYTDTKGQDGTIEEDQQSAFDTLSGLNDSHAPGEVNLGRQQAEAHLDVKYKEFNLRAGYQGRYHVQTGAGVAQALDPEGEYKSNRALIELLHTNKDWFKDWEISSQISYFFGEQDPTSTSVIFPTTFGGAFPDRVLAEPGYKEEHVRVQVSSIFKGFDQHIVRAGLGYFWGDVFETTELKNFLQDPDGNLVPNPGGFEEFADKDEVWLPEKDRTSHFVFVQDEWQFSENWLLTSGLRYDHYSDFGDTSNPRVALVWATTDTVTTKLLYGRAFRAPSFLELFAISNPVSLGNPNLDPETIDSYEFAVSYQPNNDLSLSGNIFYYQIHDFIQFVDNKAENAGKRKGRGFEIEASYRFNESLTASGNYAYQRSTDEDTNTDVGDAPNHQIYGKLGYDFSKDFFLTTQINWIGKQERIDGDERDPVSSYATVDLAVKRRNFVPGLDLSLSIRNLFDKDGFEPSPGPAAAIPGDLPLPGRNIYGEIAYNF
ncbi:ferric-rhodotorulic acid transporter [Hahella sp. CCB-MM4]|nr:ferric-rhodotorulic acid transporter [Hahella sp. CCB-MM4]